MQKSHKERSCCQEDRRIMSQRLFMPRKPLDIKLTDYPLDKERSSQLLSLPSRRGTGVGRAHKTKSSPSKKAGANVSVILGHFQKCLTQSFPVTCSHHLNLTILKWGLPARLPFKAKLKQAIPACPAVLFFMFIRLRIFFLCRQAHSL